MLPLMPELILVSEKLGITRRTVGDVLPYLVGLQLCSGGNSSAPLHRRDSRGVPGSDSS